MNQIFNFTLFKPQYFTQSYRCLASKGKMPKNSKKDKKPESLAASNQPAVQSTNHAIYFNKSNKICINVQAKPGSNQTSISDINDEAVTIQISAPPVDGEANKELVKYVTKFLELKNGDVELDSGAKSRTKTLELQTTKLTLEQVIERFKNSIK